MKKALFKNTFREIWNTKARFISIMLIVAIGVGFFVGVKSTSPSMMQMAVDYYHESNLMDFRLVSTVGFDDEDVNRIKETDGIDDVMPSYFLDVSVNYNNVGNIMRFLSVPAQYKDNDIISKVDIVEGRLPQKSGEIAVEQTEFAPYKVGDKIKVEPNVSDIDVKSQLKTLDYTVVGIVRSPMYIAVDRGTTNVGNGRIDGFAYIGADDFTSERYTVVYATVDTNGRVLSPFDDEYTRVINYVTKKLKRISDLRVEYFESEKIDSAQQKVDDGYKELLKAKADADIKFKDADQELIDGENKLNNDIATAISEVDAAQAELDNNKIALQKQWKEYETAVTLFETEISGAKAQLQEGYNKYEAGLIEVEKLSANIELFESQILTTATDTIDSILSRLRSSTPQELRVVLQRYKENLTVENAVETLVRVKGITKGSYDSIIDTALASISGTKKNIDNFTSLLLASQTKLNDTKIKLDETATAIAEKEEKGLADLALYKAQLESAEEELALGYLAIENSRIQIDVAKAEGEKKIISGREELKKSKLEAEAEFAKAEQELLDAQAEIDKIPDVQWYVFDRESNPGYANFEQDTNRIDAVATVFPLFFLLVAMLVCLTTMTRLVEEKRTEIGTLKALGYSNSSIISKFIVYSSLASILGCGIGCAVGIPVLPRVIYNAYSMLYTMRDIKIVVAKLELVLAVVVAFLCCAAVTYFVCLGVLKSKPATLMRPKAPKAGKRILMERITPLWKRMNFSSKVTWRNLFRYKSRLFMTSLGIAGCTALMLTSFGLHNSINDVVKLQFEDLSDYNTIIVSNKEQTKEEMSPLLSVVENDDRFSHNAVVMQKNIAVSSDSTRKDTDIYLTVVENPKDYENILCLRNRVSQKKITLENEGVILTEKLAKILDVKTGDIVTIGDKDDKAKVLGIAENYVNNYVYMSSDAYTKMTGETIKYNMIYAVAPELTKDKEDKLGSEYLAMSDVAAISFTTSISEDFKDMVSSLNLVVLVMIISAGALAIVVLYNLTNINLAERNREIATIKVLGFNYKETSAFVYRENIILTIFGILIGLVLGVWLWQFVVATVEVDAIMFGKRIHTLSYFLAGIMTLVFSLVVNFIMYYRIKAVDMVESLKSIE